jgi:hypothetical protein
MLDSWIAIEKGSGKSPAKVHYRVQVPGGGYRWKLVDVDRPWSDATTTEGFTTEKVMEFCQDLKVVPFDKAVSDPELRDRLPMGQLAPQD